jgi:hypothetical protein
MENSESPDTIEVTFGAIRGTEQALALAVGDHFPGWKIVGFDEIDQTMTVSGTRKSFADVGYDDRSASIKQAIDQAVRRTEQGWDGIRTRVKAGETVEIPKPAPPQYISIVRVDLNPRVT